MIRRESQRGVKENGLIIIAVCSLALIGIVNAADLGAAKDTLSQKPNVERQGSENQRAKKPFSIEQQNEAAWLIRPDGKRFFSLGVCCVNRGASREAFNPDNPAYAAWRHYPGAKEWAEATLKRLKSWGFTTVGAWSDFETLIECDGDLAFAPVLHLGSTAGIPWWDMWDEEIIARMERIAAATIDPLRGDPRVVGYYSDNEMGWWNATLFKMTLEHASSSGQRRRLMQLLKARYSEDWARLMEDFEPAGAASWAELDKQGVLYLRPTSNGVRVMREFLGLAAERYYSLMREIIRKHDPRGLVLGDRYQSFYYPEVARASARYVDAASTNLNASWNDGTFPRFYLETLHALCGKPLLISEFYMAARENRSGNKNDRGIFPVVATQAERAAAFEKTVQAVLRIPYVIGADWFQYYDEPPHGRFDGENFNFGLVDVENRPYDMLVVRAGRDLSELKAVPRTARADASQGVPRAPDDPFANFSPTLALRDWNRENGFVKPHSEIPLADLYICWKETAIYVGLYSQDIVEEAYYRDKRVPDADRATWTVSLGKSDTTVQARIGSGIDPVISEPSARIVNLSGVNHNVRNIAAMELPAKLFNRSRFNPGDTIDISSTLVTHCKVHRVEWKGAFILGRQ